MIAVNPYLIFNGNAEEAFEFYQSVFGGEYELIRFKDMSEESQASMPGADMDKVAHVALPIAGDDQLLMASDAPTEQSVNTQNTNVNVILETSSAEEAERVYQGLSEGGTVIMPLGKTEWAEKFATFTDKFGVQWMINYGTVEENK